MSDEVYHNLAKVLDTLPNGFPATESGAEIKLLKKIFAPEEAELFCDLRLTFETAEQIAERTGRPIEGLNEMLITMMDKAWIPRILKQLEDDGLADDTIIFFFGDHGVGLPRSKQFVYDSGMQVPLIIYFPPKWQHLAPAAPGSAVDRLVSFVDFGPTVLSLAGVPIPKHMQGKPFLGAQATAPRQYVFGIRDRMDERYDMTRTVGEDYFKYHRHYFP